uniref:ARAD1D27654p n=1 Tax=Blastobotrys adeninivorans TaxID=409370 RepID=A0A060TB00_BLAAD
MQQDLQLHAVSQTSAYTVQSGGYESEKLCIRMLIVAFVVVGIPDHQSYQLALFCCEFAATTLAHQLPQLSQGYTMPHEPPSVSHTICGVIQIWQIGGRGLAKAVPPVYQSLLGFTIEAREIPGFMSQDRRAYDKT